MPSVSSIAVGANMAAAAASKARHGMNENIARLSTGIRAMYGGDAAGHSVGTAVSADGGGYSMAARNIEDGISYLQMGESVLLEAANLATRIRELGIQADNAALLSTSDLAALNAEAALAADTIDMILDETQFNKVPVVDSAQSRTVTINYGYLTANTTTVGAETAVTAMTGISTAAGSDATADTFLGKAAEALGNIAADLTALKGMQGVANATSANLVAAGARLMDTDFALETADLAKNSVLNQAAMAMASQANQAQSAILAVLQ